MSIPVLTTKLYIPPPRPDFIRRTRLVDQLDRGVQRKLTLISAPAGFGKSTLVSEWLADRRRPAAWLSLDEGDSDPIRFLTYLVAALQKLAEGRAGGSDAPAFGANVLAALQASQPPPLAALLTALVNEIAAASGEFAADPNAALMLVLDDYHLVDARPVDDALAFLLDNLPPHMHVVIATREDPNLPIARYRVRGELTELRAADLRFTAAEAAAFLHESMGVTLAAAEIDALDKRTEGWVAGLKLAALAMQQRASDDQDQARFIRSFTGTHRFVMDYLVEEVLERQASPVQRFLLHTAVLDRVCGPLCDAVMDSSPGSSQQLLEDLEQANLFLIPLDSERCWYRYHHLFADLLRQRLQRQLAPSTAEATTPGLQEGIATIHRRASSWYAENDLPVDALHHALAAADMDRAAALLEQLWREMDDSRQSAMWLGWAQQLPDELIDVRPVLGAGHGWALLESGDLDGADARLRQVEGTLAAIDAGTLPRDAVCVTELAEFDALPATIAAARTYHALALGDLAKTKEYAKRTLDRLPADNHLRRGVPATLLGLAHWADGELALAYRTFAQGVESFRLADNVHFAITGAYILADIRRTQGRLHDAAQVYQRALQLVAVDDELVQRAAADLYTGLSELASERGELETAAAHLHQSEAWGGQSPLPRWRMRWNLAWARLERTQGRLSAALERIQAAERAYVPGPVPDVRPISALKAGIWIWQGRLDEAMAWAEAAGLSSEDELSYLREFEHLTLARLLIAQHERTGDEGLLQEATALLTRLLHAAEMGARTGSAVEILLLQALAHAAQPDRAAALAPLARALELAEPAGYCRLFVDEGPIMARLLQDAATRGIAPAYVAKLLPQFGVNTTAEIEPRHARPQPGEDSRRDSRAASHPASIEAISEADTEPTEPAEMVDPLTPRELEVLQLIAQGLSNREICDRLVLSIHTVKGHNRRIFAKLQVQRRTEAVAKARSLAILL